MKNNEFLNKLKEDKPTYLDMLNYCCNNRIINNNIYEELSKKGFYFDIYCGDFNEEDGTPKEIYQYYIIHEYDAKCLADFTNELVLYCENLDIFLLCVTHYGTHWSGVSANWKG